MQQQVMYYLWYKDGVLLSGAISRNYVVNGFLLSDAGTYKAEVKNPARFPNLTLERNNIVVIGSNSPTGVTISSDTIVEQVPVNTIIGVLSTEDPDVGDSHTYSIESNANLFTLTNDTLRNNAELTYADGSSYIVEIKSTDQSGQYVYEDINIRVIELASENPSAIYNALLALYNATDGPNWDNQEKWLSSTTPIEDWYGITLNGVDLEIDLSSNGLNGELPAEIDDLSGLTVFNLSSNELTGAIPDLSSLTALKTLDLDSNSLSGVIPDLSKLTALEYLDLGRNSLSGAIPNLSSLTALRTLDLGENDLSGGVPSLTPFTSLEKLDLGDNLLVGGNAVLGEVANITSLTYVDLSDIGLTGTIPDLSGLLLQTLDLGGNSLSGNFPTLGTTSLALLDLSSNDLIGSVPNISLGVGASLYLDNNGFDTLQAITLNSGQNLELDTISLSGNNFTFTQLDNVLSTLLSLDKASYSPQGIVDESYTDILWDPTTSIDFSVSDDLSSNSYAWYSVNENGDESLLPNSNGATYTAAVNTFNSGEIYTIGVRVENTTYPALTLERASITLEVNSAPTEITMSDTTIAAGSAVGAMVGTFDVIDAFRDKGDTYTYSLESDVSNNFEIVGDTLKTKEVLTYRVPSTTYDIEVEVTDKGGLTRTEAFTIEVLKVHPENDLDEIASLEAFYYSTGGGDTWTMSSGWNDVSIPLENWHGISTDVNGKVTAISLPDNNLVGTVSSLENLGQLEVLDLGGNNLDSISTDLNTANLTRFDISENRLGFSDIIPLTTVAGIDYKNQKEITLTNGTELIIVLEGESVRLETSETTPNNTYEWQKVVNLQTSTVGSNEHFYEIGSVEGSSAGEYSVSITNSQVSNPALTIASVPVAIKINLKPTDVTITPTASMIVEGSLAGTSIGDLSTEDPDGVFGDTFTYSIISVSPYDNDLFIIDGSVLEISRDLERNHANSIYQITIKSEDAGGLSISNSFDIDIIPIADDNDIDTYNTLKVFYEETGGGTDWVATNWLDSDVPFANWEGVETDQSGAITALRLSNKGMTGTIPDTLKHLTSLVTLDLANNNLAGEVPALLGSLSLDSLNLSDNGFDSFESGLDMSSMTFVNVSSNALDFRDLSPHVGNLDLYAPQALVDAEEVIAVVEGLSVTLSVSNDAQGNSYKWYKEGSATVLSTDRVFTKDNLTLSDAGVYYAKITNTNFGALTLTRSDITVTVEAATVLSSIALGGNKTIAEGLPENTTIGALTTYDENGVALLNEDVIYTLENNSSFFRIVGNELLSAVELDYTTQSTFNVSIKATYKQSSTIDESFEIQVAEQNNQLNDVDEIEALTKFYEGTGGASWFNNDNWLDVSEPISNWYGVETDATTGRVIGIALPSNNLTGSIPTETANLSSLTTLDLGSNGLTGEVPALSVDILKLNNNTLSSFGTGFTAPTGVGAVFNVSNNNFDIHDLYPFRTSLTLYENQAPLDEEAPIFVTAGGDATVSVSQQHISPIEGITTYSLFKDDELNPIQTQDENNTFTINSFQSANEGTYTIKITNSDLPALTLERAPIALGLNGVPSDISIDNATVLENQPVGTYVGKLFTEDIDLESGDTHTYELVVSSNEFEIRADSLFTNTTFESLLLRIYICF